MCACGGKCGNNSLEKLLVILEMIRSQGKDLDGAIAEIKYQIEILKES